VDVDGGISAVGTVVTPVDERDQLSVGVVAPLDVSAPGDEIVPLDVSVSGVPNSPLHEVPLSLPLDVGGSVLQTSSTLSIVSTISSLCVPE
jgi:hypothetical protein